MKTGTRYPQTIRSPDATILKPGVNNRKLGGVVKTGPLKGAVMYSLSLEERATCPKSCLLWEKCYGNNMPFAHRYDHTSPEFFPQLGAALDEICMSHKRVLVRLHVLGDFFSPDYARWWGEQMNVRPELNIYGYTAHEPTSAIGKELHTIALMHGWHRAAIRFSGADLPVRSTCVKPDRKSGSFICPEQLKQVKSCAACGACWNGETNVQFLPH